MKSCSFQGNNFPSNRYGAQESSITTIGRSARVQILGPILCLDNTDVVAYCGPHLLSWCYAEMWWVLGSVMAVMQLHRNPFPAWDGVGVVKVLSMPMIVPRFAFAPTCNSNLRRNFEMRLRCSAVSGTGTAHDDFSLWAKRRSKLQIKRASLEYLSIVLYFR